MRTCQEERRPATGVRWASRLLGVVMIAFATAIVTTPVGVEAHAQSTEDGTPTQVVIFIIDLSGSMNEPFDDTRTKLDVAKEAFIEAFTNASPDAVVGLRVYGNRFPSTAPADREVNCTQDTEIPIPIPNPIAPFDRDRLIAEVEGLTATGDTAIALALDAANTDIPDNAFGTLVLFSDGRDECFDADLDGDAGSGFSYGRNPCDVAREIAGDGVDLKIDRVETVGFRADADAELELRCIADSTGGSFTAIETPEDARDLLPELLGELASARPGERLGGIEIDGTPAQAGAPQLPPLNEAANGRYVDQIEMNTEKWYRVSEYGPGTGTFTATVFGLPAQEGIAFGARMYLPASDQTFFQQAASDPDAGLPRRPTASVRCPGCSVTGGPNDVYWVVSLSAENPDLGGTFDLELLTEGPAFGGLPTNCQEPQECWFEGELAARTIELDELDERYTTRLTESGASELVEQREELVTTVDDLEARASDAGARRDALDVQLEDLGGASTDVTLPLILAGGGVVAGAATAVVARRRRRRAASGWPAVVSEPGEAGTAGSQHRPADPAVVGRVVRSDDLGTPPPAGDPARASAETASAAGSGDPTATARAAAGERPDWATAPTEAGSASPDWLGATTANEVAGGSGSTSAAGASSADRLESAASGDGSQGDTRYRPGWYPDPHNAAQLRWWDGVRWTEHVAPTRGGAS